MSRPLNRPAERGAREVVSAVPPASGEPAVKGCWTLDPAHLERTCEMLYTLGGQETCIEVFSWADSDFWPDVHADGCWTRLLGEGVDPRTVCIAVPAGHLTIIRRRGRKGGPDSAWTTVQAFRATPGAVSLSQDGFGIWLRIDGVLRGGRITRPEIDEDGRHPVTGEIMRSITTTGVDGLMPSHTLQHLALVSDVYLRSTLFLRDFPALRSVELEDCSYVDWLGGLTALPELESLSLRWCDEGCGDHEVLRSLRTLRALDLSFTNVTDLDFLHGLRLLDHVDLEGCAQISNFDGLDALHGVRTLNLSGCRRLASLEALAGHLRLHTLRLRGAPDDLDLSPLASIRSLRVLDLRECHARRGRQALLRREDLTVLQARRPRIRARKSDSREWDSMTDTDDCDVG
jgi:hypothetical protein